MKKVLAILLVGCSLLTSCKDHDDPELAPIDTTKVKISADVYVSPTTEWLNPTEEMTVRVSNLDMSAPKGVVLRNIDLMLDGMKVMQKPYSGETLEFKLPLNSIMAKGRINLAVWGELIQQNHRDAQIIIEDNIQRVVFSETPEFECEATVDVTVTATSTTGEVLNRTFQVKSVDHFTILVPQSELYWTPASGTAATLNVTMSASAESFSTNTDLRAIVGRVYWGGDGENSKISISIPNTPGSLNDRKMSVNVNTTRLGTWENVTIEESSMNYFFSVRESE